MTHTGPGYWKIFNNAYTPTWDGDKQRRAPVPYKPSRKPWAVIWISDNPYSDRQPQRFKTHKAALGYALLGGTPIAPETLASLEER
jgi:hypothetical protein